MEKNKTAVYLTTKEAKLFKRFRQYQDDFKKMLEGRVFEFKNGCAMIQRDELGVLKDIDIKSKTYIRKKKD